MVFVQKQAGYVLSEFILMGLNLPIQVKIYYPSVSRVLDSAGKMFKFGVKDCGFNKQHRRKGR